MMSRETLFFVIFLLSFSIILVGTTWFDSYQSDPLSTFNFDLFSEEPVSVELEDHFPSKAQIRLTNSADRTVRAKLAFKFNSFVKPTQIRTELNGRKVKQTKLYDGSRFVTEMLHLEPGSNTYSINFSNCGERCPSPVKNSLDVLTAEEIDQEPIYAVNWMDKDDKKVIHGPAELHIFNSNETSVPARVSFKAVIGRNRTRNLSLWANGDFLSTVTFDKKYRLFQSPPFQLEPGENVVKFNSSTLSDKFHIKELEVEKKISDEIYLGKDFYPRETWYHQSYSRFLDFHWMSNTSTLYYYNNKNHTIRRSLNLKLSSFHKPRKVSILLNGERIGEKDVDLLVEEGKKNIDLFNLSLRPGLNNITLRSESGCQVPRKILENKDDDRCLSIAVWSSTFSSRTSPSPPEESKMPDQVNLLILTALIFFVSLTVGISGLGLKPKQLIFPLLIGVLFVTAFTVRGVGPKTYQLYLDEPWNVEVAENIYRDGEAGICRFERESEICEKFYKPAGYPFYLSILFSLFGFSLSVVFWNSVFLGAMSCVLVFLIAYVVTEDRKLSFLGALIFSIFPSHVFWSTTAESYVSSLFFILFSVLFFVLYLRDKDWRLLFASFGIAIFAATFRIENFLIFLLFPLIYYLRGKRISRIGKGEFFSVVLLGVVGLVLGRVLLSSVGQYLEILHISENLNLISAFSSYEFLFLSLGLPGLLLLWKENNDLLKVVLPLAALLSFPIVFKTGADRMLIPFLLLLSLSTAKTILYSIEKLSFSKKLSRVAIGLISLFLVILPLLFPPVYGNNAKALQTEMIPEAGRDIPESCYIVTEHPSVLTGLRNRKIRTEYAMNNIQEMKEIINNECVLFFEGVGCELEFELEGWSRRCNEIKDLYEMETTQTYQKGGRVYTFYEIRSYQGS